VVDEAQVTPVQSFAGLFQIHVKKRKKNTENQIVLLVCDCSVADGVEAILLSEEMESGRPGKL